MKLVNEIRLNFAGTKYGLREIEYLSKEYPAWSFKIRNEYGVAIKNTNKISICENFANCKIKNSIFIDKYGKEMDMLVLSCSIDSFRYQFAIMCAYFIDPGENGEERKKILEKPFQWWDEWRTLVGNTILNKKPYSVLGELLVLEELIKKGEKVTWTGASSGTYDIESQTSNYEVKSTIKKYESTITINSQYQLESEKEMTLYFCRLEKSTSGYSIDSVLESLVSLGYNRNILEQNLKRMNLENGSSIRKEKYKILEKRKYNINSEFPKITEKSFVNGIIPKSIIHITYTIDLDGLTYSRW